MSMINRLNVQGIRSFGDTRQKIEFSSPLTLIVGDNGCGKTTIIECLKYALTGDFPNASGTSFVHDLKLTETKKKSDARVELTITDPNGIDKTVFRTLQVVINKGMPKCETLDSTIKYSENEDIKFISGRIKYINNHMCESMGISKAILNNVIFCHQEDSNWPLDEGKKLKEKFDAIFGTTEYNKVINQIKTFKKQYDDKINKAKQDKGFYGERKVNVERMELKVKDTESKLENIKMAYDELRDKQGPLDAKLEQIKLNIHDFENVQAEKKTYESK